MKKQILLSCALAWAVMAGAETIDITTFRYAGPYVVQAPFQVDSVDVNSKTFVSGRLLILIFLWTYCNRELYLQAGFCREVTRDMPCT